MEIEKLLSVIVPVYNVEQYLVCCLESLLAQDLNETEYEVICVDDGSTDLSRQIIEDYAERHECIRYVYQQNSGVAAARNTGMRYAVGKYIAFVDADDYLMPNSLKRIFDEIICQEADMLIYGYDSVPETSSQQQSIEKEFVFVKNGSGNPEITTSACRFLVKRSVIVDNDLCFVESLKYGEDMLFAFYVAMSVNPDRQIICKNKIYHYRQRAGSAMNKSIELIAPQRIRDMLFIIDAYDAFLCEHPEISSWKKNNTKTRMHIAAAAVVLDSLRDPTANPYDLRNILRDKGVYPYPFLFALLKRKLSLANILQCLLAIDFVFEFFVKTKLLQGR